MKGPLEGSSTDNPPINDTEITNTISIYYETDGTTFTDAHESGPIDVTENGEIFFKYQ